MTTPILAIIPLLALSAHFEDRWTQRGLFFAVTIDPAFRRTAEARRILYRYRTIVWISAVLTAMLYVATAATAALLIEIAGLAWALADSHRRTLAWAATQNASFTESHIGERHIGETDIREADLRAPSETLPGGPLVALLPEAFIVAVAIWTAAHWDRLPVRIPIRWRMDQPQWIGRTAAEVYGFLAIEMITCLSLLLCAWGILHWSRRVSTAAGTSATSDRRVRSLTVQLFLAITYLVAIHSAITLLLVSNTLAFVWLRVVTLVVIAGYLGVLLFTARRGAATALGTTVRSDGTPDSCWKLGLIYFNPSDSSIFVARRFGFGYTLNMGNRWSWAVLAFVLGGVVVKRVLK